MEEEKIQEGLPGRQALLVESDRIQEQLNPLSDTVGTSTAHTLTARTLTAPDPNDRLGRLLNFFYADDHEERVIGDHSG